MNLSIELTRNQYGQDLPWGRLLVATNFGVFFAINSPVTARFRNVEMEKAGAAEQSVYVPYAEILSYALASDVERSLKTAGALDPQHDVIRLDL